MQSNEIRKYCKVDDSGQELASGVYLYRLKIEDLRVTKRMLLLK